VDVEEEYSLYMVDKMEKQEEYSLYMME